MELASIINQYYDSFLVKHSDKLLPGHLNALNAIRRCRTPDSGEVYTVCNQCGHSQWNPMSCGHRSCPKCQNHETSRWIDRQQDKLLPAPYFMVTFTRSLIQIILRVIIDKAPVRPRPFFKCNLCKSQMTIVKFRKHTCDSG
jgi:hypothetical protein